PRCIPLPSVCRSLTLDLSFSTFFFTAPAPTQIYTLSLHDALPISVLEDDVEVQANSCVDRATIGETRIGRGTKLDDLVLVGHASAIGANTLLCGQVGLAGSTKVGDSCVFAGQSASSGHLSVGDGTVVYGQSGLPGDLPPRSKVGGSPAVDGRLWMKITAAFRRLPELQKRVRELEAEIEKRKA